MNRSALRDILSRRRRAIARFWNRTRRNSMVAAPSRKSWLKRAPSSPRLSRKHFCLVLLLLLLVFDALRNWISQKTTSTLPLLFSFSSRRVAAPRRRRAQKVPRLRSIASRRFLIRTYLCDVFYLLVGESFSRKSGLTDFFRYKIESARKA